MIQWLVSTSLRLRVSIVAVTIVLLTAGSYTVSKRSAFDVFPEFAPPLVEVQTEGPGLSTSEVETLITIPVESALNGTSWLKKIRSKSVLGLSSVVLYFEEGTDVIQARQLVQERVSQLINTLPSVARAPVILSPLSSTSRVLKIGLSSQKRSQMEMTTVAKWTIRPRLMAIPGVANVAIWGQRDRQIQIIIDPDRLHTHGVTINDVVLSVRNATAIGGGGFIDTPNQRLSVSHVLSLKSPEDLSSVPVAFRNGVALKLGDVAELREGFPPPIGDAVINDGPGLLLIVEKEPWGNTLEVTRRIEEVLDALQPGIKDIEIDSTIFRPATFIEMSLSNLNKSLLIGCVLVILVLAFFLNDWRTALISVLAIPTSLVIASLVLHYRGGTINTMVLAGLVIALGELVDDAVIDVENIIRRLRLNRKSDTPESAFRVVLNASLEVRSAVVYGSVIVVLVLMPVFFLEGLAGSFFRPLALSYILAIMSSLFVALTLTPALSFILLPGASLRSEPSFVTWLKKRYRILLPVLLMRPKRVVSFLAGTFFLALVTLTFLGEEFLPNFKEHDFLMHWVEKPGTSLQAMERITTRVSRELRAIPGVRNFGSHIGRSEIADEVVGPNFAELWISIDPEVDYDATVARIQEVVDGYPGLHRDLLTYLRERIKEVLTGSSATIVVRIYGNDLDVLHEKAREVHDTISDVKGVSDLKVQPQIMVPQVEVRFRPEAAAHFGLNSGMVREAVGLLVNGMKVGEFYEDQNIFDVVVTGAPQVRNNLSALRSLRIETPAGGIVPLNAVADVIVSPTPDKITREAASRYTEVTCNVRGRDLSGVARDIERRIGNIPFENGYHPEILGEYAVQEASRNRIIILSILSIISIFLILHVSFGSVRLALLVFIALPFALIGGVASAFLGGGVLSLGSLIGFITVLGISARNSIMLISHYNHLETEEEQPFNTELIIRGSLERLVPILMTALTTGLALLPIIIGGNRPGQEIEHPMAIVIIGGLVSSTLLNLVVMPVMYWEFGATNRERS